MQVSWKVCEGQIYHAQLKKEHFMLDLVHLPRAGRLHWIVRFLCVHVTW